MRSLLALITLCSIAPLAVAAAPAEEGDAKPTTQSALSPVEQAFAETMAGATLTGSFTLSSQPDAKPRSERYDLGKVRKVGDGLWLIPTRIRYGDHDVTLPITLPVDFAGDTAVIRVDNIGFPGLGTYSARVLIHDHKYAGYWQGGDHGGHLFGQVTHDQPDADAGPAE